MIANSNKVLIPYQEALEILASVAAKNKISSIETIPLLEATGRLLADDILSPINVPTFNNSAMDGFAIQSDIINPIISKQGSIKLHVSGSIQAGDHSETQAEGIDYLVWEIMTGAPVPDVFDAVIQIENVIISKSDNNKYIEISENVFKGRNIRKLGTDYRVNQLVVNKHTIIQAQHIMALATVGVKNVTVIPKINVAILSTGNELAKKSSHALTPGEIFNSNQPFLNAYCQNIHCNPVFSGHCKDSTDDFHLLIDQAIKLKAKIIFSTGAVSMGKYDFIPQALLKRGAVIHFHKSKIRPGKPILFAELTDGTVYFGLPGNPIAAASGMRFFAAPFINNMLGLSQEKTFKAKLLTTIKSKKGFKTFAKAFASVDDLGHLQVEMLQDQGSYQSRSFAQSNCWLIIPEDKGDILLGELIEIAPIIPNNLIL